MQRFQPKGKYKKKLFEMESTIKSNKQIKERSQHEIQFKIVARTKETGRFYERLKTSKV